MQGAFTNVENDELSLIIDDSTFELIVRDSSQFFRDSNDKFQLSDSVVLKNYKKNYFLSMKEPCEKNWYVIVIKIQDEDNFLTLFIDGEDSQEVEKLKRITKVWESTDSDGRINNYVIDPLKKELEKILQKKLFSGKWTFTKKKNKTCLYIWYVQAAIVHGR